MYVCMYACMYVCMYVWVYVCMYILIYTSNDIKQFLRLKSTTIQAFVNKSMQN